MISGTGQITTFANTTKSADESENIERQANILARTLLITTGQVKRAFYNFRSFRSREPTISLAELFGISKQAMSIFMKEDCLNYGNPYFFALFVLKSENKIKMSDVEGVLW